MQYVAQALSPFILLWLAIALLILVFGAPCTAYGVAKGKGRDAVGWFWLTLLFTPLMLVYVYMLPAIEQKSSK